MTDQELKRLRDLCEKATPGPWKNDCGNGQVETEEDRVIICNRCGNYDRLLDCFGMYGIRNEEDTDILNAKKQLPEDIQQLLKYDNEDDMEFIAEARTAIPKLLDEVETLQKIAHNQTGEILNLQNETEQLQDTHDVIRENNKLRATFLPWSPETAFEYRKIIADADLVNENQQLRSRIKKLRKALRYFSAAKRRTVFEILPDNNPINPTNPTLMIEADNERAEKALAQDDEMEGK